MRQIKRGNFSKWPPTLFDFTLNVINMAYQNRPASSFQPCDSYFVESFEPEYPGPRLGPKEHAKLIARERQFAIADELSKQVSDEYQDDILAHMLAMDVRLMILLLFILSPLYPMLWLTKNSPRLCRMLIRSISRPRSNGSCVPISSTSS